MSNASKNITTPLVVIVGPTASGKTSLAVDLAEAYNGEIICADSRTIYRGADIGTAKPTDVERRQVPHWGLDLVDPGEVFTAFDFKKYANNSIKDIRSRGKVPFLVGGTGLYVDAVILDYQFGSEVDRDRRAELEAMSIEQLHQICVQSNIDLPENLFNKRYVIRAIERQNESKVVPSRRTSPVPNTIVVGISTDRPLLKMRIYERADQLFENGVVDEAISLGAKFGWDSEAMTGNIYPLVRRYLNNEISMDELKQSFVTLDWRLAKRQMTWLRRNKFIKWLPLDEARAFLIDQLARE